MTTYDVALSFAGEQRRYVERVAVALRDAGLRVFYDEFEQSRLWGRDLVAELDRIYRKEARCVVMFVSAEYREKKWTRHEFRSVLSTAIEQREEYVLPVRFDHTDLDGLAPSLCYADAAKTKPSALAKLILNKIALLRQKHESDGAGQLTLDVWRIVSRNLSSEPFSHWGASHVGGRWNCKGQPAVYTGSNLCVSVLETVALSQVAVLGGCIAVSAKIVLTSAPTVIDARDLPADWQAMPSPVSTQEFGSKWLVSGASAVLSVPSVILPAERIFVLNPAHPDFKSLTVVSQELFDPRFLKSWNSHS
jgi:RES domain-containing protein